MNARRTILAVLIPAAAVLAAGLFLVSRADAQSLVQQQQTANGFCSPATSISLTLPSAPGNTHLLIMVGGAQNIGFGGITVTGGGVATWTVASRSDINKHVEIWYGITNGSSSVVTLDSGGGAAGDMWMQVSEWSGMATTGVLDQASAQSGTTSPASAPSITTTNANDLLIFGVSDTVANTFGTPTPGTWTALTSPPICNFSSQAEWYRVVSTTAAYAPTVPVSGLSWDAALAAFKAVTKFYFHDAATPDTGTLPAAATTLSATAPSVTAPTAGTNRDMNQTIGTAQVSQALTTLGQTGLKKNWFRRFLSRPLAAQILPTGVWTIQGGASESNAASNMLPWGAVIKVWRPSANATVATLLDNPTLGTVEPGTSETNISSATASNIGGQTVADGDILVVELWAQNTQGNTTARTNTIFYDGTTEGSITSNAAFLQAPGVITFSTGGAAAPGGFNAYETATTPAGAITGVIKTKIAGSTVSLDIIALNAAKTAIATTFTGTVRVEVLNASNNTGFPDANGCGPNWTVILPTPSDPTFVAGDNGRKTISFTQANSYPNVRLRITYPAGAPTVTGCSTDNFAIRPNTFASFAVTDTDWVSTATPGARALNLLTFAATTPLHKAGRPFSVRATAVNAAGTPATTTNYVGAPTATLTACAGAACTATFGTLTLSTTFVAGQLASDVASYNNVGSFRFELVDSSFASVDAGDSSALEREIRSGTLDVGRFVPDHFAVSLNAPVFGPACGSFSYVGQAFNYTSAPAITVTAQDFANSTTTLYNTIASWFRITNASLTGKAYTAATGTLDVSGLPGTDPVIASSGAGVGTLTFGSGTGLFFTRSTTTPAAPYSADIALGLNVIDADGIAYASNPASFGAASAGNGIAFSGGNKGIRYGRMRLLNGAGPTTADVPMTLQAEYYVSAASGFTTNTTDTCTSFVPKNFVLFGHQGSITPANMISPTAGSNGNVSISGGLTLGVANLKLLKPTGSVTTPGSVKICLDLDSAPGVGDTSCQAATPANQSYLQGPWSGSSNYDKDPSAQMNLGLFGAQPKNFIFFRENY
jgi:hypothetical protein